MKKTINEIMVLNHCYKRERVEKLFADREYLTLDDVESLPISHSDKVHMLVELMTHAQWRLFARRCALRVIHLWDAPEIVIRYLNTGDETIRDAARAAACDSDKAVTKATAWAAAWAASKVVAHDADHDPAHDTSRIAAKAAACNITERIQQVKIAIEILEEKTNDMGKN